MESLTRHKPLHPVAVLDAPFHFINPCCSVVESIAAWGISVIAPGDISYTVSNEDMPGDVAIESHSNSGKEMRWSLSPTREVHVVASMSAMLDVRNVLSLFL